MQFSGPLRHTVHGVAALVVAAGSVGVAHYDKSVQVTVDGQRSSVHVLGSTVADVLDKQGIEIGAHDVVVPSPSSHIEDGDQISVRYGRKLTVNADGETRQYWTTATTVDAALNELDIRAEGAVLSTSRSQVLGRQGLAVSLTTPKKVSVVVDGKTRTTTSVNPKVSGLLAELDISRTAIDRVRPALDAPLTEGMTVVVQRIVVKKESGTEAIAHATTKQKDSSLYVGQTKVVTPGKDGKRAYVREVTYVDGEKAKTKELSAKTLVEPTTAVVKVGTKERTAGNTSGAGINLANSAMWDRIAECESGGNWSINTGNGYYGGLQFSISSWLANGGDDFASRPDLASRAEQITVANRYYAKAGLSPWGCAHAA